MENEQPKTFQEKALDHVQLAIAELLEKVPELRSVVVTFDWGGRLAESAVPGIWLDRNGPVTAKSIYAVTGGMQQTVRMLQVQQQVALHQIAGLVATIEEKQQVANRAQETLDAQKQSLTERSQTNPAEYVQRASQPGRDFGGPASTGGDSP